MHTLSQAATPRAGRRQWLAGCFRFALLSLVCWGTLDRAFPLASRYLDTTGGRLHAQQAAGPATANSGASATDQVARETWDALFLRGAKVGYARTRITPIDENGRPLLAISVEQHLALKRFGQPSDQEMKLDSVETPQGEVLRFVTSTKLGAAPIVARGKLDGDKMIVETNTAGKVKTNQLPWSSDIGGVIAVEQSLSHKPMQPGEKRAVKSVLPMLDQTLIVTTDLHARQLEPTLLLNGTYYLLRIESSVQLAGGLKLDSVLWANRVGEVLKTSATAMGLETYRTTRVQALNEPTDQHFDLGYDSVVRVARAIDPAAEQVRYRVRLREGDPMAVFVSGWTQRVRPVDEHTADVTVRGVPVDAIAAASAAEGWGADPAPTAADRQPNSLLQSDDPAVTALAAEAAGDERDPVRLACRLEEFVHDRITTKNFSQALATAAEVAKSLEGDCTEHAVLLAALARARGIPARVAIGLVYMPGQQGFGYHMWNELYVGEHWVPFDATLGRSGIGATHLKLAHSNLKETNALTCFLPVAQVLGQLEIEVLD
ncbi:MAG: transglutaminase family protein [Pirellulales bacterium]